MNNLKYSLKRHFSLKSLAKDVFTPHENEIYMRHIQLFGMKIYFEGLGIIYVKYILANISQKIYAKYILIIQLFAKIYFVYFDIYVTYIFFHAGHNKMQHPQLNSLVSFLFCMLIFL